MYYFPGTHCQRVKQNKSHNADPENMLGIGVAAVPALRPSAPTIIRFDVYEENNK